MCADSFRMPDARPTPEIQPEWHVRRSPGDFNIVVEVEATAHRWTAGAQTEWGQRGAPAAPASPLRGHSLTD